MFSGKPKVNGVDGRKLLASEHKSAASDVQLDPVQQQSPAEILAAPQIGTLNDALASFQRKLQKDPLLAAFNQFINGSYHEKDKNHAILVQAFEAYSMDVGIFHNAITDIKDILRLDLVQTNNQELFQIKHYIDSLKQHRLSSQTAAEALQINQVFRGMYETFNNKIAQTKITVEQRVRIKAHTDIDNLPSNRRGFCC